MIVVSITVFFENSDNSPINDAIYGTPGDVLEGTNNADNFIYLGGNDIIYGNGGLDADYSISFSDEFTLKSIQGAASINANNSWTYGAILYEPKELKIFLGGKYNNSNLELDQNNAQKDQLIFGTVGHDHLIGTTSDDVIDGIGGNDRIDGD